MKRTAPAMVRTPEYGKLGDNLRARGSGLRLAVPCRARLRDRLGFEGQVRSAPRCLFGRVLEETTLLLRWFHSVSLKIVAHDVDLAATVVPGQTSLCPGKRERFRDLVE
eukprot:4282162-Pyramimonas_sp.AAC.1